MLLAPVTALFHALLSQKLAPSEKNSIGMSAASAALCISGVRATYLWKAYIKTLGIACVKSLRMRASYLLECMQQTFRSVCILPVEMCTFFSLSASVHIFLLSALFSVFESLSICLCPRNLNLILVRKKYYEMISISLAVTVDTWTMNSLFVEV